MHLQKNAKYSFKCWTKQYKIKLKLMSIMYLVYLILTFVETRDVPYFFHNDLNDYEPYADDRAMLSFQMLV